MVDKANKFSYVRSACFILLRPILSKHE